MALRTIEIMGSPVLREKCAQVDVVDDDVRVLVRDMMETMYHSSGIGLAAPQVGLTTRVIVVDPRDEEETRRNPIALVNPQVVWSSKEKDKAPEGCLSIPGMEDVVQRPASVVVEGLDPDGDEVRIEAEGLLSRVLQHEIDHLDGVLFVDRLTPLKRRIFMKKWKKLQAEKKG
jgi:peptide deformylase